MTIDRAVIAFAGFMIMATLLLAHYHNPLWIWFTAFVGFNLFQSAFTGFCPLAIVLKRFGLKEGACFR
ncbi:MAG TPA: DUF2892 domain-containing protein [Hyphomicrobiaceae bacterium]|nr:DUF2892 domain-containing protein [Hyphomicrobiaceae bacterium]